MSNYRAAGVSNESYPAVVPDKSQAFFTDSRPSKSLPFQMHIGDNASNCGSFACNRDIFAEIFLTLRSMEKKVSNGSRKTVITSCLRERSASTLMQKSSFSSPFPQSSIASQRVTNADSLISVAACSESIQEKEKRVELCQDTLVNDEETDLTLKLSMIVPKKAVQTMLAANELSLEAKYKVTVKLENAGNAIKLSLIGLRKDVFRCFLDVGSHFPRNERDFDLEVTKFGQSEQHSADIDGSVAQIGSSAVLVETAKASAISPEIGVQEAFGARIE
uniref:Uncharacterized protein n=1 Tax=Ditylenchus dipsaci TaxID=166011 RepID=A0A915DNS1_9BILA